MIKPSDKVIRAVIALEGNTFWAEILDWLHDSLITQSIANNSSTGEVSVKNQGRNLELQELLKFIKQARAFQENAKEAKRMEER